MEAIDTLPGRREKRKQEIRVRIEQAAYALFKAGGIEDVSIELICGRADVARRTFYAHYPNKQALLRALSRSRIWDTADDMLHTIMETHESTAARMAAMIDYMAQHISSYEAIDRALMLITSGSLADDNHLHAVSNSLRDHFANFFRLGQQLGDTTTRYTPELLSEMVVGTTNTLLLNWAFDPHYPIFDKLAEARRLFSEVICLEP